VATTYTWSFDTLETATVGALTDVVKIAHWRITGTTDDATPVTATIYGSAGLKDVTEGSFVAYNSLTLETVKSWVLEQIRSGDETVEECEARFKASIDTSIASQITPPTTSKSPPWA